jgi:anaerobic magnesium-protoporphyrin IX monomethyl ester cyclase
MRTQRVLLVNPPFYRVMGNHYNGISLGISYIASNLNHFGHNAWVYNADYLPINYYQTSKQMHDNFDSYESILANKEHWLWDEVANTIANFQPDWVGYTAYTANLRAICIISEKLKAENIRQVVGGVQSTLDPEGTMLALPAIDYSVQKEGEFTMLKIVSGQRPSTIPGITYRTGETLMVNPPDVPIPKLGALPYPERAQFWVSPGRAASNEEKKTMDVSYIISLRGCPYRCSFCASPAIWGRTNLRYRNPDDLIQEMIHIKENHWVDEHIDFGMLSSNSEQKSELLSKSLVIKDNTIVYFVDDVFTLKKHRSLELMQCIIDSGLQMPWKCESRADNIDQEIAAMMAASGCKRVKIGLESGSDRILKQLHKDETRAQMLEGINCLRRAGVPITAYFMAGFPGETDADLLETIKFAREIKADYYSLSILAPYYGSQIYYDFENTLSKEPWDYFFHQTKKLLVNTTLSDAVLEEFWKLCEKNVYV